MARKIEVQLVGDSSSLDRAFRRSSDAGTSWGKRLKSAGKVAGLGIVAGVGLAAVALKKSVDAAKEAELSQGRVRAQLKASGLSWEKHRDHIDKVIESQSKLSAFDDEDLADSFTNILRITGDVNKALEGNALAADFARAKGIPVAKAGELIAKVMGGNVGILARYGIKLKEGATAQEALAELQKKFGGQAKAYGDSTAGAQEKFGVALENVQEKIGAKLLPMLTRLFEWGIQFVGWAETNWPRFSAAVTDAVDRIRPVFQALVDYWNGTLLPTIESIIEIARSLWGRFGEDIKRNLQTAIDIVKNLLGVLKGIFELVMAVIRGDWSAAWDAIKSIVRNALGALMGLLRGWITNLARIGKALGNALKDGIVGALRGLAGLVGAAARGAINAVIDAFNALGDFTIPVPMAPDIHVNFPNIPHVATGGDVSRTGLAMIHKGERVQPAGIVNRGGGGPMQLALVAVGPDIMRQLRELDRKGRRGGAPGF